MAKKKECVLTALTVIDEILKEANNFSGIARSVEAYDNQGFRNFRILTLHIEKGQVVKVEHSDPYANFEAISRLELANELAILHLNDRWENGRTLSK